jgi:hypothetical protein
MQCTPSLRSSVKGSFATVQTLPATEPAGIESSLSIFITLICDLKRISIRYFGNFCFPCLHLIFWVDHFYIIWRDWLFPSNYFVTLRGTEYYWMLSCLWCGIFISLYLWRILFPIQRTDWVLNRNVFLTGLPSIMKKYEYTALLKIMEHMIQGFFMYEKIYAHFLID